MIGTAYPKRSQFVTSIVMVGLLSLATMPLLVFGQSGITVNTNRESLSAGDQVVITGAVNDAPSGTPVAIEVRDAQGQTVLIRTVQTDENGEFSLQFRVPQSTPVGEFRIFASAQIGGQAISGTKSVSVSMPQQTTSETSSGSGNNSQCIIATAAFGSELAPQVQFLRNFRDNHILSTAAGSSFMNAFNAWYYSFSPYVAEYERGQPWLQQTVRAAIYPLLGILTLSERAYSAIPGEYGAITAGTIASTLIGAVYVAPIALSIKRIRTGSKWLNYKSMAIILAIASSTLIFALGLGNPVALMVGTSVFVVSLLVVSALALARFIAKLASPKIASKTESCF